MTSFFRHLLLGSAVASVSLWTIFTLEAANPAKMEQSTLEHLRNEALYRPIFSIDGSDATALREATERLEHVALELSLLQEHGKDRVLIRHSLYPTRFLRVLSELEEQRDAFLKTPTSASYRAYTSALRTTLQEYRGDLQSFLSAFREIQRDNPLRYVTLEGVVDAERVISAGTVLLENSATIEQEIDRREDCANGSSDSCEDYLEVFYSEGVGRALSPAPDSVETILQLHSRAGSQFFKRPQVFLLEDTACTKGLNDSHVILLREPKNELTPPSIIFGGDVLFYDARSTIKERRAPMIEAFYAKGIEYVLWNPNVFYNCPRAGAETGMIFSLLTAHESLGDAVMEPLDEKKILSELRIRARGESTESHERPWTRLLTMIHNRSAGLEHFVNKVAHVEEKELEMVRLSVPVDIGAKRLFTTQSGFPSLFLAYNRSVFPGTFPALGDGTETGLVSHLVGWSELHRSVTESAITKDLEDVVLVHEAPETLFKD